MSRSAPASEALLTTLELPRPAEWPSVKQRGEEEGEGDEHVAGTEQVRLVRCFEEHDQEHCLHHVIHHEPAEQVPRRRVPRIAEIA